MNDLIINFLYNQDSNYNFLKCRDLFKNFKYFRTLKINLTNVKKVLFLSK